MELKVIQDQILCKKQELANLQDQLYRHPEWIRSICDDLWLNHEKLSRVVSKISFLKDITGTTSSRKNPIKYHGWHFQLDGSDENYYFRTGSNWCSEVIDVGNEQEKYDLSRVYLMDNFDEDSAVLSKNCLNEIAELPALQMIGYMFLYVEGW